MASFEIGKTYKNTETGMSVQVIALNENTNKYLLLRYNREGNPFEYVVCRNFDSESVSWDCGNYFTFRDDENPLTAILSAFQLLRDNERRLHHVIHGKFETDGELYYDESQDEDAVVRRFVDEVKYKASDDDLYRDFFFDEDGNERELPEDTDELFDDLCSFLYDADYSMFERDIYQY